METLGFSSGGKTRYDAVRPGGVTGGDDTPTTVRMIDKILSAGPAERWNACGTNVGHDTSGFRATGMRQETQSMKIGIPRLRRQEEVR